MTKIFPKRPLGFHFFFSSACLVCLVIQPVLSQEYEWPTDASRLMTSSFGEYRDDHFHAGIDIKTWGQIGYQVFAIEKGCINRIRVSPYGYGRAVYLLLDNGLIVVYAHLSRFSEPVEKLVKEEQKKQGRFAIDKTFLAGQLPVEKGELVGFTGRSGTRDPHLHFEVRINENTPINPLLLGYAINDQIPPIVNGVAVSPLRYGSQVNGDFQPKIFSVQKENDGFYRLTETIQAWGQIGLSVSAFDQANGASNSFAVYRIRLYVNEQLIFTTYYNYFPYDITQQIELDRDYRLHRWGWGLFQKLYCDIGNELPLYEPASIESGTLSCWDEVEKSPQLQQSIPVDGNMLDGSLDFEKGFHEIRIEALDYFGNRSTVIGTLQMIPLSEINLMDVPLEYFPVKETVEADSIVGIRLKRDFMDDFIRFCVESNIPLPTHPLLYIQRGNGIKTPILLWDKSDGTYVGSAPLNSNTDGQMITELHIISQQGLKYVVRDTLITHTIDPNQSSSILSEDRRFQITFPEGSLYRPVLGTFQQKPGSHPDKVIDDEYLFYPQDVPLKHSVTISIKIDPDDHDVDKLGIYQIGDNGHASFLGKRWGNGTLSVTTGSLSQYTVLRDTVPPEITTIRPAPNSHIRDLTPLISVGFKDTLSGIYGEDHYQFFLDSVRLIVEYDPINNLGFYQTDEPLDFGLHTLDIMIEDQNGNKASRKSQFIIDPE
ncbi:M23 family metallopeptidase [bacterium]|nr:M23 family metallopeptidase [bacterium]